MVGVTSPRRRQGAPVQVLAHRGASRRERENTLVAFRVAASLGAHAVELDARPCADGSPVVHHDARLADGRAICEVAQSDLPDWVPSLAAALDACAGMWVNVEVKNDESEPDFDPADRFMERVATELHSRGEDGRWLVSSFRRDTIDACRAVLPSVATAWLTVNVPADSAPSLAADLRVAGHSALHPWVGSLTREVVTAMHAEGLSVNPWTCDDPVRMAEIVDWGVDGICTNEPDVALGLLAGRR
jgi:glycerophosphoryl diester phosphodiesterase